MQLNERSINERTLFLTVRPRNMVDTGVQVGDIEDAAQSPEGEFY